MYRYTIGQDRWESYSEAELLHTNEYSRDEFLKICKEAFAKLDYKNRKHICDCYGDDGVHLLKNMLIKEFQFILPDKVTSHIHMGELLSYDYENHIDCEDCSKSYELNGVFKCSYDECKRRELLKEDFE